MTLTRRGFSKASVATGGLLMAGLPLAQPATSATASSVLSGFFLQFPPDGRRRDTEDF